MKNLKIISTSLFAGFLFVGCGGAQFPKVQHLGGLRILGIQASSPELSNSALPAVVNLTPIVSDLGSGGRTLTVAAQACPDPGVSFGVNASCVGVPGAVTLSGGPVTPSPVAPNSQLFGTPTLTGALPSIAVTVPAGLLTGRSPVDQYNGVGYLVTISISTGTESVSAYKRIRVSTRSTPNSNPDLTGILSDGVTLAALPGGAVNLSISSNVASSIDYLDQAAQLKVREKNFTVSFFVSDGELRRSKVGRTETNKWTPPGTAPSGRPATVVAVLYDGEGGMDYLISDF